MRSWRFALVLAVVLIPVLVQAGQVSFDYGTTPRTIRACVLLIPNGGTNPNPYVLPMLARSDLRPAGWTFVNPLAPTNITSDISGLWGAVGHSNDAADPVQWRSGPAYWTNRLSGLTAAQAAAVQAAVPPEWPQYWEVPLNDTTADELTQFDLIYVANAADLNVTSTIQRAGLLRAVESGAVLWVDNAFVGQVVDFPVPRSSVAAPFTWTALAGPLGSRTAVDPAYPLLANPFVLSDADVAALGYQPTGSAGPFVLAQQAVAGANFLDDVPFTPVVNVTNGGGSFGPEVIAAHYGDGAIVVTSEDVGQMIEGWYAARVLGPSLAGVANYKLAYNIANFAHTWGQAQAGPAHHGLSLVPAAPPLDLIWQFPAPWDPAVGPPGPVGPFAGSPVISDGRVFALSTIGANNATPALWCLSAAPAGASGYQVLWSASLGAFTPRASSPAACAIDGLPVVLVSAVNPTSGAGEVIAYNAAWDGVTGSPVIWSYTLPPYTGGQVIDLSSPVVYKNWVFVLANEYDSNLQGGGVQGCYARVWVLDLATGGATTHWVYPDATRSGQDGVAERQKLLPPLDECTWLDDNGRTELPPDGDNPPAVCTSLRTPFGLPVEAALLFHCRASIGWVNPDIVTTAEDAVNPGEQYAFIPTALDAGGAALLNADYFATRLSQTGAALIVSPAYRLDGFPDAPPTPSVVVDSTARTAPDGGSLAWLNNVGDVLRFLDTVSTGGAYSAPVRDPAAPSHGDLRLGCRVRFSYAGVTDEVHFVPGPVAWVGRSEGGATSEDAGCTLTGGRHLSLLDSASGAVNAIWNPDNSVPPLIAGGTPLVTGATALDSQNALAKVLLNSGASALVGLRTQPDFNLHLGPGLADSLGIDLASPLTVTALEPGFTIPATAYTVDYANRVLRFDPTVTPSPAGKAFTVAWRDSGGTQHNNELHVAPSLARFTYVGGYVQLQYYPVDSSTVQMILPDGSAVTGAANGENTATVGARTVLPNGWMFLGTATVTDSAGVSHPVVGKDVIFTYTGWSEADRRWVTVSNAAGADYPAERHQVPYPLPSTLGGARAGGVSMAGQTALVPCGPATVAPANPGLLALLWDPVSNSVKGFPSWLGAVPSAISSSPSTYRDRVYAGTGIQGDATGHVDCLGPRHTLICDGNRLVGAVGATHTWSLTGSQVYAWGRTAPEPQLTTPFNRPAKASALTDGTYLVVDTGNNRVIQVDRAGNQLWPLDEGLDATVDPANVFSMPCDYYSSPARTVVINNNPVTTGNDNLDLAQPSDAYRWVDATGTTHTLIADSGHNRVVHILTAGTPGGPQTHQVIQVTPDFVRPPWDRTHPLKLRYTRAQPIFDFGNGNLIGYLCAAANIDRMVIVEAGTKAVDPDPSTTPAAGTRPWSDWSWVYNLQFSNLRHAEYFLYGNVAYVAVAAGGLGNNLVDGVWIWEIDTTAVPSTGGTLSFTYTAADYADPIKTGALSSLTTPANITYTRRFYPVGVKVLYPGLEYQGNVMITNYTGIIENLARENVGSSGTGLYGEVFEVDGGGALQDGRTIPDPWQADWNDPINQPTYAERY